MIYAIIVLILLILDQGAKYLTLFNLPLDGASHKFIPGVIDLIRVHNSGAAFGLFEDMNLRWPFVGLAVVFAGVIIFLIARGHIKGAFGKWMAILVIAGALGNAIDRALFGSVIDMIHFEFFPKFPVFNVADIYVVIGGIAFCLYVIFHKDYVEDERELAVPAAGSSRAVRRPAERETPLGDLRLSAVPSEELASIDPDMGKHKAPPSARPRRAVVPPAASAPVTPPAPLRPAVEEFMDPAPRQRRPAAPRQPQPRPVAPQQRPTAPRPDVPSAQPRPRPVSAPLAEKEAAAPAPVQRPRRPAPPRPEGAPPVQRRPAPAPAPVSEPAPKKAFDVNEDIPEFSLEDILAEFSDN